MTLPAVSSLTEGTRIYIYNEAASVVTITPNAADRIRILGTSKSDGVSLVSNGTLGEVVTLFVDSSAGWSVLSMYGTWA